MQLPSKPIALISTFGLALGLVLTSTAWWRSAGAAEAARPGKQPLVVPSLVVDTLPGYQVLEAYNGRIMSRRSSRLGFSLPGQLTAVLVQEGDHVEAGELLARIDSNKLRAARRVMSAQLAETKARLELAQLTLARTRKLAGQDSVSRQRHDEARIEEVALTARLEAGRASIEGIDVDLYQSSLRAPYPGSITRRVADEGTILAAGQEVLHIIESGAMEAKVGIPPATTQQLELGRAYDLRVDGRNVQGVLRAMMDDIASDTRTVTAVFTIDDPPPGIRHGALARLMIETQHGAEGFWLPITALAESRRGLWSAYALVPEDGNPELYRVDRRELQLIHTESDRAFLRGTLKDGDRVVSSGLQRLVPNQWVRLAREEP